MAYVKILPVKTRSHLHNLIDYEQNENKTMDKQLITCHDCQLETAYADFAAVRRVATRGQLLAHQMVQSFEPGETTPEQAHQLGIELAEKTLPGYQYTVCTHVDKGHIHNHIVFNSVSYLTGERYHGNKTSLKLMQEASNEITRKYGLSVISKKSGYKGLDRTTYELKQKGHSWKLQLVGDLDRILKSDTPRSLKEFVTAVQDSGYFVKVSDRHIVVTKIGEKKGIRLDTLARQFGVEYTRENIERRIRGEPVSLDPPPVHETPIDVQASEWQRAERAILQGVHVPPASEDGESGRGVNLPPEPTASENSRGVHVPPEPMVGETGRGVNLPLETTSREPRMKRTVLDARVRNVLKMQQSIQASHTISGTLWRAVMLGILMLNPETRLKYRQYREYLHRHSMDKGVKVDVRPHVPQELRRFGNVTLPRLLSVYGETVTMKVTPDQAARFAGIGIFYAGNIRDDGTLTVSFKAANTPVVAKALNIEEHRIKSREELADERSKRTELKRRMENLPGSQRVSWKCSVDELRRLDAAGLPYDYSRIRDGYRVGLLDADLASACMVLGWDLQKRREDIAAFDNRLAYRNLKTTANERGVKLSYRVMTPELLEKLRAAGVECVAYEKGELRNVAMLPESVAVYEQLIQAAEPPEQQNLRIYREIKEQTAAAGTKPVYRVVTMPQLEQLKETGLRFAWFPKEDKANVAMTPEEWEKLKQLQADQQQATQSQDQQREQQKQEEQEHGKKHHHSL